jgi:hypothetical protein
MAKKRPKSIVDWLGLFWSLSFFYSRDGVLVKTTSGFLRGFTASSFLEHGLMSSTKTVSIHFGPKRQFVLELEIRLAQYTDL